MGSQFSYELDERQIRIVMQDAELGGQENLWNKFELLHLKSNKSNVDFSRVMPALNFNISRSVILPVIFVILIGGLSAMLFSFIDFKKKETATTEIPLIADPHNYKKLHPETQPSENLTQHTTVSSATNSTATEKPKDTSKPVPAPVVKPTEHVKAITVESRPAKILPKPQPSNHLRQQSPKKIKRKVRSEALPSIDATTIINLNEGAGEPELDLK
ncbi:MAG: hypothetical protein K0R26_1237 [Bacteroidota bacterium]|nr:hypothetical protein [Bacteroidota bacterium]